jgi:hypothetical protein
MLAALACMLAAAPAAAQDAAAPVQPAGSTAISLDVGSGYLVGLWRQLSPRTRAGVEVGAAVSRTEGDDREQDLVNFVVSPTVKLFSGADGALRPYTLVGVYVQGFGQHQDSDGTGPEYANTSTEAGARAGVGLEWMPLSRLAVGGHVGVRGGYLRATQESNGTEQEQTGWSAGTFSSGIVLTLFF